MRALGKLDHDQCRTKWQEAYYQWADKLTGPIQSGGSADSDGDEDYASVCTDDLSGQDAYDESSMVTAFANYQQVRNAIREQKQHRGFKARATPPLDLSGGKGMSKGNKF